MAIQLEIVTPEAKVFDETVESVVLPTTSGEIGIMPGHIPIVTEVAAGAITVARPGGSESLAVSKGFAQCIGDKVSILAEHAINAVDIDIDAAEEAEKRAEEALKSATEMSDEETNLLETTIQYAHIQRLLKQKK